MATQLGRYHEMNIEQIIWPKTRVIIITAHGTIASAVAAMKLGPAR